jgi:hypothetical protein
MFSTIALTGAHWASAQAAPAKPTVRETLDKIKQECGITGGQFSYDDEVIRLHFDGMIEDEKLRCASDLTDLVGATFQSYDTSAPFSGPSRYIVKGHPKRVDTVAAAALAAKWTITHRADSAGGVAFLEIETGAGLSRREVRDFLDRFMTEFSDVPIGLAPRTLAGYDKPMPATVFRSAARSMYKNLAMRSCNAPAGFDREAMLRAHRASVGALEREFADTEAGVHLRIAREDIAGEDVGCWADDVLAFAKLHVEMVQKSVRLNSAQMRQLAPAVDPLPRRPHPANAAQFRGKVRDLIEWTLPLCSYTSEGDNDSIFAGARARIAKFRNVRLRGTPYALHFRIAEDDASYERSRTVAECDDPDARPVAKLSNDLLKYAEKRVSELEKLVQP